MHAGRQSYIQATRQAGKHTGSWQTDVPIDRRSYRHTVIQAADIHTGRQTYIHADRQPGRQANIQVGRQANIQVFATTAQPFQQCKILSLSKLGLYREEW